MTKNPKQHKPVGEEFLEGIPTTLSHPLPFPSQVVWAALLDGPAWSQWLPLDSVEWTSPQPLDVGATRTVTLGKDVIEEFFFGWEEGRRMAFRFDKSTLPVSAAVEDYRLRDTTSGCVLDWTFRVSAMIPINWIMTAKLKSTLRKSFPKLEAMLREDPDRFGG